MGRTAFHLTAMAGAANNARQGPGGHVRCSSHSQAPSSIIHAIKTPSALVYEPPVSRHDVAIVGASSPSCFSTTPATAEQRRWQSGVSMARHALAQLYTLCIPQVSLAFTDERTSSARLNGMDECNCVCWARSLLIFLQIDL